MSDSLHQRIEEIDAGRGTIYSEDGQMLSTSLPTFDIYIDFMADGLREKNGKRFKENIDSFPEHWQIIFMIKLQRLIKLNCKKHIKRKTVISR